MTNTIKPLRRVLIKEELISLTGDLYSAVVLSQFDYWAKRTRDFDDFIEEENKRIARDTDNKVPQLIPTYGWVYKSAEQLLTETMLGVSLPTIRKALAHLVSEGWLLERRDPRFRWNKTKQYRLDILKTHIDLLEKGYSLEGWELQMPKLKFLSSKVKILTFDSKDFNLRKETFLPAISNTIVNIKNKDRCETEVSQNNTEDKNIKEDTEVVRDVTSELKAKQKKKAIRYTEKGIIDFWRRLISDAGYGRLANLSFNKVERGMIKSLLRLMGEEVEGFLTFSVQKWKFLREDITWGGAGRKSRLGQHPNFSEIYMMKEDILAAMDKKGVTPQGEIENKSVVYTRIEDVPKDHSQYKDICIAIKGTGRAELIK